MAMAYEPKIGEIIKRLELSKDRSMQYLMENDENQEKSRWREAYMYLRSLVGKQIAFRNVGYEINVTTMSPRALDVPYKLQCQFQWCYWTRRVRCHLYIASRPHC